MFTQAAWGWTGDQALDVIVTNRTGGSVSVGDVLLLDSRRIDAASTNNTPGSQAAGTSNVVIAQTNPNSDWSGGVFCVALGTAGDDFQFKARLVGHVDKLNVSGAITLATTEPLIAPHNGSSKAATISVPGTTSSASFLPAKVIAIPLTATSGAGLTDAMFDGIKGFGQVLVS